MREISSNSKNISILSGAPFKICTKAQTNPIFEIASNEKGTIEMDILIFRDK
jgi:hypothetical protein